MGYVQNRFVHVSQDSTPLDYDDLNFAPDLQWALQATIETDVLGASHDNDDGTAFLSPPAPPELEEAANGALRDLRSEIQRVRRSGVPDGHTWSASLVPLVTFSSHVPPLAPSSDP